MFKNPVFELFSTLCTKLVQCREKSLSLQKRIDVMTMKKDLYNLHCRVKHSTAERLKSYSEELGLSVGEVIDLVLEGYEEYTNSQDELMQETDIYDQLSKLLDKVERIEKKVGA